LRTASPCGGKVVRSAPADRAVWAELERCLCRPEEAAQLLVASGGRLSAKADSLESEAADARSELAGLDREAAAVWAEQEREGWPLSWVAPKLKSLAERRQAAERRLERASAAAGAARRGAACDGKLLAELVQMRAAIRASVGVVGVEVKRRVAEALLAGAVVRTLGEGRKKAARLELTLRWGAVKSLPADARRPPNSRLTPGEGISETILAVVYL
jgi:hypothetical protein